MKAIRFAGAVAAFGAAMILAPATALAGPNIEAEFTALDKNGDGFLTGLEFMSKESMASPVTDWRKVRGPDGIPMYAPDGARLRMRIVRDGQTAVAAPGEVVLTYTQSRQYQLNRYDSDADDRLSLAEYRDARVRGANIRFNLSDKNSDERLTLEEFIARLTADPPTALSAKDMAAYETSIRSIVAADTARFKELDVDGDGFLSRGEWRPV